MRTHAGVYGWLPEMPIMIMIIIMRMKVIVIMTMEEKIFAEKPVLFKTCAKLNQIVQNMFKTHTFEHKKMP